MKAGEEQRRDGTLGRQKARDMGHHMPLRVPQRRNDLRSLSGSGPGLRRDGKADLRLVATALALAFLIVGLRTAPAFADDPTGVTNAIPEPVWMDIYDFCSVFAVCAAIEGIGLQQWVGFTEVAGALNWIEDDMWELISSLFF